MTHPTAGVLTSGRNNRIDSVQYLRGLAALAVAYAHLVIQIPEYRTALDFHGLVDAARLTTGVDVFFAISGFIMIVTSSRATPWEFLKRRLVRIVPLYWCLTLLLVLAAVALPSAFHTTRIDGPAVLRSLFFVPDIEGHQGGAPAPILVPGWTLNLEMFFYLVFAAALLLPRHRRWLACGLVFAPMVVVGALYVDAAQTPVLDFYTKPRMLEFWLGMGIGELYLSDRLRMPKAVCAALLVIGGTLLLSGAHWPQPEPGFWNSIVRHVLPASLTVLAAVAYEHQFGVIKLPALRRLGDISYSLYLSHVFSLGLVRYGWVRLVRAEPTTMKLVLFVVLALATAVIVADVVYRLLEVPSLRWLHRFSVFRPRPGATAKPAAGYVP